MDRSELTLNDHVRLQLDADPELEDGSIMVMGKRACIISGVIDGKGYWRPVLYEDILEVVPHGPQPPPPDGINKGDLMIVVGKLDGTVTELKELMK